MRLSCDIDGVLAEESLLFPRDFAQSVPRWEEIHRLNALYGKGCEVVLHTSRQEKYREVTEAWLSEHRVMYNELVMGKPRADVYIDDRNGELEDPYAKNVLLYSGGVDSVAYALHLKQRGISFSPVWLASRRREIHGDSKVKYWARRWGVPLNTRVAPEHSSLYPRFRNLTYACIALENTEGPVTVHIGGLADDRCEDKTPAAFEAMSQCLSQISGNKIKVVSWFFPYTKKQVVEYLIRRVGPQDALKGTVSCYGGPPECGSCPACYRKWIAFEAAGVPCMHHFFDTPLDGALLRQAVVYAKGIQGEKYHPKRVEYTQTVAERFSI